MKNEDIPENKEIFIYGVKHNETDKIDEDITIGCESNELYENNILFNIWFNKFVKRETKQRNFEKTG